MITSVMDYFQETVRNKKNSVAVIHNEESITFGELDTQAKVFAAYLKENVGGDEPVGVFLPKGIHIIVADLGSMYANHPFMNLDVKNPPERIQNIIDNINPVAIVTGGNIDLPESISSSNITIIDMDVILSGKDKSQDFAFSGRIDTDPMCIINTSGSTGTPKGVVLNHRSFLDFIGWADEEYGFNGSEVIGSLSPAVFDIFDFELCMLICKGSQIVVLDSMLASFPVKLLQEMKRQEVNFIFWVPSIMVNIANMDLLGKIDLPALNRVWFAGEVFPTAQFCYWYDHLPQADFTNLYGPIEITLDCTFYRINERPRTEEPLPIGVPCRNTDILILNEKNERCSCGQEGELCVRGTSLAMGYYNDPEKTDGVFVQNPLNKSYPELIYRTGDIVEMDQEGLIHFKGRRDSLIKHLGYRIELGEIEHVITNELQIVDYCCAVYNQKNKKIVLFYECVEEKENKEFREQLKSVFPNYMIPGEYHWMKQLPKNTNGKIDRLQLQQEVG